MIVYFGDKGFTKKLNMMNITDVICPQYSMKGVLLILTLQLENRMIFLVMFPHPLISSEAFFLEKIQSEVKLLQKNKI